MSLKFVAVHEWTATSFFQGNIKVYADVNVTKETVENYINKLPGMSGGNWSRDSLTYKYVKIKSKIATSHLILKGEE